jgi:anti-anti-sigma factor
MMQPRFIQIERADGVFIATPLKELAKQSEEGVRSECDGLICELESEPAPVVLLDLSELDYFGSIVLELMVTIWKTVLAQNGRFALCGVSQVGWEILQTTRFDTLWTIYASREEALRNLPSQS